MSIALVNIGDSHTGDLAGSRIDGDAVICDGGRISWIGKSSDVREHDHETIVDVAGATLIPGFIDSHFHSTFADFTPRQNTVGYIESYLHGGMTRAISASEVHVPGRPSDVEGVKALAIAAQRCFQNYRHGRRHSACRFGNSGVGTSLRRLRRIESKRRMAGKGRLWFIRHADGLRTRRPCSYQGRLDGDVSYRGRLNTRQPVENRCRRVTRDASAGCRTREWRAYGTDSRREPTHRSGR